MKLLSIIIILVLVSCNSNKEELKPISFDKEMWLKAEDGHYPYRELMQDDVLHSKRIRSLNRAEILENLGTPDRVAEQYLYYTISTKKIGAWPLNSKTLVFKFTEDDSIEWIKLHG